MKKKERVLTPPGAQMTEGGVVVPQHQTRCKFCGREVRMVQEARTGRGVYVRFRCAKCGTLELNQCVFGLGG